MNRTADRQQINLRLEPDLYYLLELTTRIEQQNVSDVVRQALQLYFDKAVSPHLLDRFEEPLPGDVIPSPAMLQGRREHARKLQLEHSLMKYESFLWDDKPFSRLMKLNVYFRHLISPFEAIMLEYLLTQPQFLTTTDTGPTYDCNAINSYSWKQLQADAFAWHNEKGSR